MDITAGRLLEINAEIIKAKKDFIHGIPPRYTLIDYAEELIAAVEESQAEAHLEGMTNQFDDAARIFNERLQVMKDSEVLLHGEEEWTNQEDADTEAVILELITAVEASQQQLAEANECCDRLSAYFEGAEDWKERCHERRNTLLLCSHVGESVSLRYLLVCGERRRAQEQEAEAQAEVGRLRKALEEYEPIANLRAQLAASQAEVERLQKENELYAKHIDILSPEKTDER